MNSYITLSNNIKAPTQLYQLLDLVYNGEIETVDDLVDKCNHSLKALIPVCIEYNLIFLSSDDRLLLTEVGAHYYINLFVKQNL